MPKRASSQDDRSRRPSPSVSSSASARRPGAANGHAQAAVWSPPVGIPMPAAPVAEAVTMFGRAMQALQRHRYQEAGDQFQQLVAKYPTERALLDRARVYADLCARELARRPVDPATTEERITAATAALNNGDEAQAERLANVVLAEHPSHDLALYILAALHARRGDAISALDWLGRAVEVSPDVRAQARHDVDFEALRGLGSFQELLEGPAAHPAQTDTRRFRRGRSER